MTAQPTLNRLTGPNRAGQTGDQRITVCKLCPYSILTGQARVWLNKPMGLSHRHCAVRARLVDVPQPRQAEATKARTR